jgi:hypothetical protein
MSSRAVRKLLSADSVPETNASEEPGVAVDDHSVAANEAQVGVRNPFAVLADQQEHEDGFGEPEKPQNQLSDSVETFLVPESGAPSRRKGRSRRASRVAGQKVSAETEFTKGYRERTLHGTRKDASREPQVDDENLSHHSELKHRWYAQTCAGFEPFAVDTSKLNADGELKHLFGREVVERDHLDRQRAQSATATSSRGSRAIRQQQRRYRERNKSSRYALDLRRRSLFVYPNPDWFQLVRGLTMEPAPNWNAPRPVYRYRFRDPYNSLEEGFEQVVRSGDHELLIEFSWTNPFHVGALLQLSELYRVFAEAEREQEAIERALWALEISTHPRYRPGEAYLPFAYVENRQYYRALCCAAERARSKGAYRSATEIAKVLCTLDPPVDETGSTRRPWSDPVGALLVIDAYALLAKEWQWICQCLESEHPAAVLLRDLPNWQFSYLYAKYKKNGIGASQIHASLVDAVLLKQLRMCVERFPHLARLLAFDARDGMESLPLLCRRAMFGYASRTAALWRNSPLMDCIRQCLGTSDARSIPAYPISTTDASWIGCVGYSDDIRYTEWIHRGDTAPANGSVSFGEEEAAASATTIADELQFLSMGTNTESNLDTNASSEVESGEMTPNGSDSDAVAER